MELLSNELIKEIQEKIVCWMEDLGIEVCMDQGSSGFENYIQVKLAGFLKQKFEQYVITIESGADILVSTRDGQVVGALELKIGCLGGKDSIKFNRSKDKRGILDDIDKLLARHHGCDRILVCVVYQFAKKEYGYAWGPINKSQKLDNDYQQMVIDELDKLGDRTSGWREKSHISSKSVQFGRGSKREGCVDIFVF